MAVVDRPAPTVNTGFASIKSINIEFKDVSSRVWSINYSLPVFLDFSISRRRRWSTINGCVHYHSYATSRYIALHERAIISPTVSRVSGPATVSVRPDPQHVGLWRSTLRPRPTTPPHVGSNFKPWLRSSSPLGRTAWSASSHRCVLLPGWIELVTACVGRPIKTQTRITHANRAPPVPGFDAATPQPPAAPGPSAVLLSGLVSVFGHSQP
ncbi:hypothetical protein C7974DRAFT_439508 [Boeremia exigua]|uniref:uncharacterized protein n=1 Tax=Boeremia exigua TaxID=749465 RepID=UPI001E8CFB70|nr:uncharacterized protein C7974DRAFT_439508 [Boeremia exigua]KAH6644245.1 hypothetical protein C7974DRAFT_439508 [Boeremia exigua]